MNDTARRHWTDLAALGLLAALTLLFFWKIALTNRVLAGLDVFAYFYPYRDFVSEALRVGRLPLWNPYLFMGAPLLANSQAAVLYPLHWPLIWLSTPKQIAWSIVLHVWLAGAGTYLFARRVQRLRPLPSFATATVFALGGFLGAQVEHINQLNASAWLPWLLLCLEGTLGQRRRRWPALLSGGAIAGLMLLAGHTQAAYIVLFGAGIYALLRGWQAFRQRQWQAGLRPLGAVAATSFMGLVLAAGQLLPTSELSRLSVRSGGLPYNEAASFSLKPTLLFKAFLPPLFWEPPFSEYVAYVGLIGLALATVGVWAILRRKRPGGAVLGLALIGVFLAFGAYNPVYYLLYKAVPGIALFRAPARWLLLYSFGAAILAGIGLEAMVRLKRWHIAVVLLLVVELFIAGRRLAYNNPTAPAAFDSLRTAPAHLLADAMHKSQGEPFRFLSMSGIRYDPGDLSDLQAMYRDQLSAEAIYDLIVATKMKEVLAYNLPLRYRLFSVDGYDGGLLPVKDYVTLEQIFLAEDEIWPDGRLRQQLEEIPPARLLSLLNVKYVLTDKTQDAWIDDVFYDLEHTVPLGEITLRDLPPFESTHLGLVYYLAEAETPGAAEPVAQVIVTGTNDIAQSVPLLAGEPAGDNRISVLDLEGSVQPRAVTIRSLLPAGRIRLRGTSLIDKDNGTSRTLSIHPAYRLVHSGDVKIYQNLDVLPRAFVVHQARQVKDNKEALSILADPGFDPARIVLLSGAAGSGSSSGEAASKVKIVAYEPERVQIHATLQDAGWLVLTDAFYPGWQATVDGQEATIQRADLYFRAVPLQAGEHEVVFGYQPGTIRGGIILSAAAWLAWGLAVIAALGHIGRKSSSSV